jgi:ketosteroid isomerase-like protein
LAVNWASWTLTGTGPDGAPMEMQGRGYDVMRRQSDGSWKMVIDSPRGH